jgi:hypothetical protein
MKARIPLRRACRVSFAEIKGRVALPVNSRQNLFQFRQRISPILPASCSIIQVPCRLLSSEACDQGHDGPSSKKEIPYRTWLDIKLPLEVRVNKLVETGLAKLPQIGFDAIELADQCCRRQDFWGMKLAHDVLDRVLSEKRFVDSNNPNGLPFAVPVKLFQKIMYGWAVMASKEQVSRVRMRETLDLLLEVVNQDEERFKNSSFNDASSLLAEERLLPTTALFNTYLTGLRNGARLSRKSALEAEKLLDKMMGFYEQYGWHCKPNTRSYTLVIAAHAEGRHPRAAQRAEGILRKMQRVHEEEKKAYLSQYNIPYNTRDPYVNKRKIVTVDEVVYTTVIRAYSKTTRLNQQ